MGAGQHGFDSKGPGEFVPRSLLPDVALSARLEKIANLLQLAAARAGVVKEIAELARVGLDLRGRLLELGIAFQDEHLMLGTAFLAHGVHRIGNWRWDEELEGRTEEIRMSWMPGSGQGIESGEAVGTGRVTETVRSSEACVNEW